IVARERIALPRSTDAAAAATLPRRFSRVSVSGWDRSAPSATGAGATASPTDAAVAVTVTGVGLNGSGASGSKLRMALLATLISQTPGCGFANAHRGGVCPCRSNGHG